LFCNGSVRTGLETIQKKHLGNELGVFNEEYDNVEPWRETESGKSQRGEFYTEIELFLAQRAN